MPCRSHATRSRLENLKKIKKHDDNDNNNYGKLSSFSHPIQSSETLLPQTAVLDEPDKLDMDDDVPTLPNDDSDGSSVEILDSGSDTDICEESELTKFSQMLHNAQKKALAEEKAMGNKRKAYTGHSRATAYRQKRQRSNLANQGYLSVHEFMRQMESRKNKEKLTAPQELTFEESEESSDDDIVTVSQLCTSESEKLTPDVIDDDWA
jgi:hypothetical protein